MRIVYLDKKMKSYNTTTKGSFTKCAYTKNSGSFLEIVLKRPLSQRNFYGGS